MPVPRGLARMQIGRPLDLAPGRRTRRRTKRRGDGKNGRPRVSRPVGQTICNALKCLGSEVVVVVVVVVGVVVRVPARESKHPWPIDERMWPCRARWGLVRWDQCWRIDPYCRRSLGSVSTQTGDWFESIFVEYLFVGQLNL